DLGVDVKTREGKGEVRGEQAVYGVHWINAERGLDDRVPCGYCQDFAVAHGLQTIDDDGAHAGCFRPGNDRRLIAAKLGVRQMGVDVDVVGHGALSSIVTEKPGVNPLLTTPLPLNITPADRVRRGASE